MQKLKSQEEYKYTSTNLKFLKHPKQIESYLNGTGKTIISTHISPEGSCNLNCPYCSVAKRDQHERIAFGTIVDYIKKLKSRDLQACIITGGGEATLYPNFNELVHFLKYEMKLSIALITNGTCTRNIDWDAFTWVRVSINEIDKIHLPKIQGTLGCSIVYTGQTLDFFQDVVELIENTNVEYVRVIPNCLQEQRLLIEEHKDIDAILERLNHPKFFHQYKLHRAPVATVCHQAYFRPYLSEVGGGMIYPCDSVVLNNDVGFFSKEYAICKAEKVLDFLDGKIKMPFDPREKCAGCVFTDTVDMLDEIKKTGIIKEDSGEQLVHGEFV